MMITRLGRAVWFLMALCVCSILSMSIGYAVVRYVGGASPQVREEEIQASRQAENLSAMAKDLVSMTAEYLDRVETRATEMEKKEFQRWLTSEFLPHLDSMKQRAITLAKSAPQAEQLVTAIGQVFDMAKAPDYAELRVRATENVLEASNTIELYASTFGVGARLAGDDPSQ